MSQIIGNNTLLGTVAGFNQSNTKKLRGTTQETVLAEDQRLIAVHVGWGPGNTGAAGSIKACLYDQGNASANKPMISGTQITIPYDASTLGASPRWVSVTGLSVDLSAHAGKTLCPGIAGPLASSNSGFSVLLGTVTGAKRENSNVISTSNPDPFVSGSAADNQAWSVYFETETIGGTITLDSVLPNPVTNTGSLTAVFSGNASSGTVKLIVGAVEVSQTVTSWSYNGGTDKTTVVSTIDQGGLPFGAVTARYNTGGNDYDESIAMQPISGNAKQDISSPQNTPGYIFEQLATGDYLDVDQIEYTDSPNTVVDASGLISQTVLGSFQARARDSSDDTWSTFSTIYPHSEYEYTGSGGMNFAGSAAASRSWRHDPSGGLIVGGAASFSKIFSPSVTGGLQFGGSATYSFNGEEPEETIYIYEGDGGLHFGGAAVCFKAGDYTPSLARTLKIDSSIRIYSIN